MLHFIKAFQMFISIKGIAYWNESQWLGEKQVGNLFSIEDCLFTYFQVSRGNMSSNAILLWDSHIIQHNCSIETEIST